MLEIGLDGWEVRQRRRKKGDEDIRSRGKRLIECIKWEENWILMRLTQVGGYWVLYVRKSY